MGIVFRAVQCFSAERWNFAPLSLRNRGLSPIIPIFLVALLLLVFPIASFAGEWISDKDTGCQVWNPGPVPGEGIKWSGACLNGTAVGKGILQWFKDGSPTDRYEGEYRDGQMNGKGTFTGANGNRYEGDFVDGKQTGKGTQTWANGDRYEGDWLDGKRTGKGIYTWPDGDRYEGDFLDGKMSGKGTKTGSVMRYEGDFLDGKRHGKGTTTWTNNGQTYKYEGDWLNGNLTTLANGEHYRGQDPERVATGSYPVIVDRRQSQEASPLQQLGANLILGYIGMALVGGADCLVGGNKYGSCGGSSSSSSESGADTDKKANTQSTPACTLNSDFGGLLETGKQVGYVENNTIYSYQNRFLEAGKQTGNIEGSVIYGSYGKLFESSEQVAHVEGNNVYSYKGKLFERKEQIGTIEGNTIYSYKGSFFETRKQIGTASGSCSAADKAALFLLYGIVRKSR